MIDDKFKKVMRSNTGCAVIMAGSDSDDKPKGDKPSHMEQIALSLENYGIPYIVRISSAHKEPGKTSLIVDELNEIGGLATIVAVAGGTDALSGTASFHSYHPVVSCPPDAPNESCLNNPPGSSNSYIPNPKNVGKHIAQMYAGVNPKFKEALEREIGMKIRSLEEADRTIQTKYERRPKR